MQARKKCVPYKKPAGQFVTPNRQKKADKQAGAENPQAADDKAEKQRIKKKDELPESSP